MTKEEFDKRLAEAKGSVLVEFTQKDCGACEATAPDFEKLTKDCEGTEATVLRVDVDEEWVVPLADKLNVAGTPTALLAKSADAFLKGKVTEVDPASEAVRTRLKCARPAKSTD